MVPLPLFRTNRLRAKSNLVSLENFSLPHQGEGVFLFQNKNRICLSSCGQRLIGRQTTRREDQGQDDKGRDSQRAHYSCNVSL